MPTIVVIAFVFFICASFAYNYNHFAIGRLKPWNYGFVKISYPELYWKSFHNSFKFMQNKGESYTFSGDIYRKGTIYILTCYFSRQGGFGGSKVVFFVDVSLTNSERNPVFLIENINNVSTITADEKKINFLVSKYSTIKKHELSDAGLIIMPSLFGFDIASIENIFQEIKQKIN